MRRIRIATICALALTLPATLLAQSETEKTAKADAPSWPALDKKQGRQVAKICQTLRRAKKPEQFEKAESTLTEMGAGVAPLLFDRMSDHGTNINRSLTAVLDRVTTREHATLLAAETTSKKVAVRQYVLLRLTSFQLPELAPVFREARKDKNPDLALQAALGLASAGSTEGLQEIFDQTLGNWSELKPRLVTALPGIRGDKATTLVTGMMQAGDIDKQTTGLRLLRYLATSESAKQLVPLLDSEDNTLKKATVNALRVAIDGEEALENMSVFDAINRAKKWKERLR